MIAPESFCLRVRERSRATWDAVNGHRFFREIAADTLEDRVFRRYLAIEYGFLDTAAIALGQAVAKAPSFRERRHLALVLHGLVTDQEQFFVQAFHRVGATPGEIAAPRPRAAEPLHAHFLDVARNGGYEDILATLLGAEWLYMTWCSLANRTPSARPVIREWVALHAGGAFAAGVDWVRAELDARAATLDEKRRQRLGDRFEATLTAEIPFHSAAYD